MIRYQRNRAFIPINNRIRQEISPKQSCVPCILLQRRYYGGKQIVKPDELQEVNPSVFKADNHAVMERSRDVVMKQNLKGHRFILLAVENQKIIDYSMPVRIMLQEALT